MLGWLRLRPSGCALCAICQMSNACQRQHVRAISYVSFLISAFFHRIVVVVVVYPGVKCIGQHSALGLALGLGSGPLSSLGVSAILLYLSLTLFPFLSAWVWVVDCHFLRCGNLRLLIKKYTHRKHVEGIMRLFCCYCTLPPFFLLPLSSPWHFPIPLCTFTFSQQMAFPFATLQWLFVVALCGMNIAA